MNRPELLRGAVLHDAALAHRRLDRHLQLLEAVEQSAQSAPHQCLVVRERDSNRDTHALAGSVASICTPPVIVRSTSRLP